MKLYHYSPHKNLDVIDPAYYATSGKNISPEYRQGHKHLVPRSYFYTEDRPESVVSSGRHRYEVWMPKDFKVYDLGQDPENIVELTHKESGLVGNGLYDLVEHKIKERGYHGYHNSKSPLAHVTAMFHPIKVEKQHPHPHSYDWHDDGGEEPQIDEPTNKAEYQDQLEGGVGDKKKPSDFPKEDLLEGVNVELEHTDDRKLALEIAIDHLSEDPAYYKKLKTIEKNLRKDTHPHQQAHGPTTPKPEVNEQAGGSLTQTLGEHLPKFGKVTAGKKTNLNFYGQDLPHHEEKVDSYIKGKGNQVYFAGGKYGKPDLKNKNYNTGHLMVFSPEEGLGGDFGKEALTRVWRKAHEQAHHETYPMVNKIYGEGRRLGKLGQRTLHEMHRALYWEDAAVRRQREILADMGHHISDQDFNKERNTVLTDALTRAISGKFSDPSDEGFEPHDHHISLKDYLNVLDEHAKKIGLKHPHDKL